MTTKQCTVCNLNKPISLFRFRKDRNKEIAYCQECERTKNRNHYKTRSRDKINRQAKERYQKDPVKHRELRIASSAKIPVSKYRDLKNRYGFECNICGTKEAVAGKSLAYDHDHKTGSFRGFLCIHCNQGLGKFFDRIDLLEKAIKYLSKGES